MPTNRRALGKPFRIMRSRKRLFVAIPVGIAAFLVLPASWPMLSRALVGWDIAVVFFLVSVGVVISQFDLKRVRARAAEQDEGAILMLILTVAAAIASVGAILALLGPAKTAAGDVRGLLFALTVLTIVLSWAFIHFIFALHYAHEFYGEGRDQHRGGLIFPGDNRPDYWDFMYFAFVVGMTFQVSDVQITSKPLRHVVVLHGIVSFYFSVAILALAVNIGSSLI